MSRPTSMYGEFTRRVLPLYPSTDPEFMIGVVCCKKTYFFPTVCLQAYIFSFHLQLTMAETEMTYFEYIQTVFTKIRLL